MWFADFLFLARNWAKDEKSLKVNQNNSSKYTYMYLTECFYQSFYLYISLDFCWQTGFEQQVRNPVPFWLALFAEGTRFTQTKLIEAQEFARSRGMPIPKNVLVPRTKVNKN